MTTTRDSGFCELRLPQAAVLQLQQLVFSNLTVVAYYLHFFCLNLNKTYNDVKDIKGFLYATALLSSYNTRSYNPAGVCLNFSVMQILIPWGFFFQHCFRFILLFGFQNISYQINTLSVTAQSFYFPFYSCCLQINFVMFPSFAATFFIPGANVSAL